MFIRIGKYTINLNAIASINWSLKSYDGSPAARITLAGTTGSNFDADGIEIEGEKAKAFSDFMRKQEQLLR